MDMPNYKKEAAVAITEAEIFEAAVDLESKKHSD